METRTLIGSLLLMALATPLIGAERDPPMADTLPDTADTQLLPGPEAYAMLWSLFEQLIAPAGDNVAFERLRSTSGVYLPKGERPPPVGSTLPLPPEVTEFARKHGIADDVVWLNLDSDVKVSALQLRDKWGGSVRYALQMNDVMLGYVLDRGLYAMDGLLGASPPPSFPNAALELKSAWIWIDEADKRDALADLYHIAHAYYVDAHGAYQIGEAALSGLHVVPKLQPGWVWATFENVHNASFTEAAYELPIDPELQKLNAERQEALKRDGSIFANYRLNGVQTTFTDTAGDALRLANSQIESYFQKSSSCKTCHAIAAFRARPRLQFFNIVDTTGRGTDYFTGDPPSTDGWTSMDYVWSLRRAQWSRP